MEQVSQSVINTSPTDNQKVAHQKMMETTRAFQIAGIRRGVISGLF